MATIEVEMNVLCESCGRPLGHELEPACVRNGFIFPAVLRVEACADCIKDAEDDARKEACEEFEVSND